MMIKRSESKSCDIYTSICLLMFAVELAHSSLIVYNSNSTREGVIPLQPPREQNSASKYLIRLERPPVERRVRREHEDGQRPERVDAEELDDDDRHDDYNSAADDLEPQPSENHADIAQMEDVERLVRSQVELAAFDWATLRPPDYLQQSPHSGSNFSWLEIGHADRHYYHQQQQQHDHRQPPHHSHNNPANSSAPATSLQEEAPTDRRKESIIYPNHNYAEQATTDENRDFETTVADDPPSFVGGGELMSTSSSDEPSILSNRQPNYLYRLRGPVTGPADANQNSTQSSGSSSSSGSSKWQQAQARPNRSTLAPNIMRALQRLDQAAASQRQSTRTKQHRQPEPLGMPSDRINLFQNHAAARINPKGFIGDMPAPTIPSSGGDHQPSAQPERDPTGSARGQPVSSLQQQQQQQQPSAAPPPQRHRSGSSQVPAPTTFQLRQAGPANNRTSQSWLDLLASLQQQSGPTTTTPISGGGSTTSRRLNQSDASLQQQQPQLNGNLAARLSANRNHKKGGRFTQAPSSTTTAAATTAAAAAFQPTVDSQREPFEPLSVNLVRGFADSRARPKAGTRATTVMTTTTAAGERYTPEATTAKYRLVQPVEVSLIPSSPPPPPPQTSWTQTTIPLSAPSANLQAKDSMLEHRNSRRRHLNHHHHLHSHVHSIRPALISVPIAIPIRQQPQQQPQLHHGQPPQTSHNPRASLNPYDGIVAAAAAAAAAAATAAAAAAASSSSAGRPRLHHHHDRQQQQQQQRQLHPYQRLVRPAPQGQQPGGQARLLAHQSLRQQLRGQLQGPPPPQSPPRRSLPASGNAASNVATLPIGATLASMRMAHSQPQPQQQQQPAKNDSYKSYLYQGGSAFLSYLIDSVNRALRHLRGSSSSSSSSPAKPAAAQMTSSASNRWPIELADVDADSQRLLHLLERDSAISNDQLWDPQASLLSLLEAPPPPSPLVGGQQQQPMDDWASLLAALSSSDSSTDSDHFQLDDSATDGDRLAASSSLDEEWDWPAGSNLSDVVFASLGDNSNLLYPIFGAPSGQQPSNQLELPAAAAAPADRPAAALLDYPLEFSPEIWAQIMGQSGDAATEPSRAVRPGPAAEVAPPLAKSNDKIRVRKVVVRRVPQTAGQQLAARPGAGLQADAQAMHHRYALAHYINEQSSSPSPPPLERRPRPANNNGGLDLFGSNNENEHWSGHGKGSQASFSRPLTGGDSQSSDAFQPIQRPHHQRYFYYRQLDDGGADTSTAGSGGAGTGTGSTTGGQSQAIISPRPINGGGGARYTRAHQSQQASPQSMTSLLASQALYHPAAPEFALLMHHHQRQRQQHRQQRHLSQPGSLASPTAADLLAADLHHTALAGGGGGAGAGDLATSESDSKQHVELEEHQHHDEEQHHKELIMAVPILLIAIVISIMIRLIVPLPIRELGMLLPPNAKMLADPVGLSLSSALLAAAASAGHGNRAAAAMELEPQPPNLNDTQPVGSTTSQTSNDSRRRRRRRRRRDIANCTDMGEFFEALAMKFS